MHKSIDFLKKDKTINKKILFLDIDGVIQGYNTNSRFEMDETKLRNYLISKYNDPIYSEIDYYDLSAAYFDWDEIALGYIKDILRSHNAYIVIHSGWRESVKKEHLIALFKLYDMDGYILDVLPSGKKETVIQNWLKENSDISNFMVIDDDNMVDSFGWNYCRSYNVFDISDYRYINGFFYSNYEIAINDSLIELKKNGNSIVSVNLIQKELKGSCLNFIDFNILSKIGENDLHYFYKEISRLLYSKGFNYIVLKNNPEYNMGIDFTKLYNLGSFFFDVIQDKSYQGYRFYKDNKSELLELTCQLI